MSPLLVPFLESHHVGRLPPFASVSLRPRGRSRELRANPARLSGLSRLFSSSGFRVSLVFRSANQMNETSGTWGMVCLVYLVYPVGRTGNSSRRT